MKLKSAVDYRRWLQSYVAYLAQENFTLRLKELFDDFLINDSESVLVTNPNSVFRGSRGKRKGVGKGIKKGGGD